APSSAGNPRMTRQKASTSASGRSDSGGSPEPLEGAPGTSTKSISAQLVLRGLKMAASASTRGSGTLIAPRLTWPRAAAPPLCSPVRALNSVVLPDCAYPTRPAFMAPPRGGAASRGAALPRPAGPHDARAPRRTLPGSAGGVGSRRHRKQPRPVVPLRDQQDVAAGTGAHPATSGGSRLG